MMQLIYSLKQKSKYLDFNVGETYMDCYVAKTCKEHLELS